MRLRACLSVGWHCVHPSIMESCEGRKKTGVAAYHAARMVRSHHLLHFRRQVIMPLLSGLQPRRLTHLGNKKGSPDAMSRLPCSVVNCSMVPSPRHVGRVVNPYSRG